MSTDAELVVKLKMGDARAIANWYKQYAPKLKAYFGTKVRQVADSDELVHDTFLSCLSSLPLYRGDSSLYTFMIAIARHELGDYYRKLYAKKVLAILPMGEQFLEALAHEKSDLPATVEQVLSCIPQSLGELLALKYIDKLSVRMIATKLSLSVACVQARLYRARQEFKKHYEWL